MPAGRPTKYDPAYCEQVEKDMAEGYSLGGFAGLIGVSRATMNVWMAQYPDFLEAVSRAKAQRQRKWEKIALEKAQEGGGQPTLIVFGLKNMGHEDWSDSQHIELTGKGRGPIETKQMSAVDALESRISALVVREPETYDIVGPDGKAD